MELSGPTVFYSWQNDLPKPTNRYFLQAAIKRAVQRIAAGGNVERALRMDEATTGVPGAPDIAATIFSKIDNAAALIADVSLVNTGAVATDGASLRPTPNPNVLVEVGYALKAMGAERLILVVNTAYGPVEQLPFDLRPRRVVPYHLPPGANKASAREKLVRQLVEALTTILAMPFVPRLPAPDLPWRDYINPALGPARFEGAPAHLYLRANHLGPDVIKFIEQRVPTEQGWGYTPHHSGLLQPIVFFRSVGGYVHLPADPIVTPEHCYDVEVSTHRLIYGGYIRDLVVRWRDIEGYRWLAVLQGHHDRYRLAEWKMPMHSGSFLQQRSYMARTPIHRLTIRKVEEYVAPAAPPYMLPEEEVVEELWLNKDARRAGWFGTLPEGLLASKGLGESNADWIKLTRVWRMFTVVSEEFTESAAPPDDEY